MPRNSKGSKSGTTSWISESDQYNIGDELEWNRARVQNLIRDQRLARESMESLFKKRREDALEGVRKAQHHLEFVNREEERLRKAMLDEDGTIAEGIAESESEHMGSAISSGSPPLLDMVRGTMMDDDIPELGLFDEEDPSPLKQALAAEEGNLSHHKIYIKEHERKAEVLLHLIARFERPEQTSAAMIPNLAPKSYPGLSIEESEIAAGLIGGGNLAHSNGEPQEDIIILKEWLETEERMIGTYLHDIEASEMKISSYRLQLEKFLPKYIVLQRLVTV